MNSWIFLTSRNVIKLSGTEARSFLHGLVTQNIIHNQCPLFSALLTPQGRFQSDFFVLPTDEGVLLDCDRLFTQNLLKALEPLSILHGVHVQDVSQQYAVCVALGKHVHTFFSTGENTFGQDDLRRFFYKDPRHEQMGVRVLVPYEHLHDLPNATLTVQSESEYHAHRIHVGIPDGAHDLSIGKSIILEYGYHFINALSWDKGCYMGQELMARTFHQGQIRKELYRATLEKGIFPPAGTDLFYENNRVGSMGGHQKTHALASLSLPLYDPLIPIELSWGDSCKTSVLLQKIFSK
jgi:folate-binding protein YgfZ